MRPTPAASTLSEFRWRMWAVCRRWVAPVCAGTARAWRTPDDGLLGGAFWPFQDRAFSLGALHFPLPSPLRSEEHTSELQSLMRFSYAVFCLPKQQYLTRVNHRI